MTFAAGSMVHAPHHVPYWHRLADLPGATKTKAQIEVHSVTLAMPPPVFDSESGAEDDDRDTGSDATRQARTCQTDCAG